MEQEGLQKALEGLTLSPSKPANQQNQGRALLMLLRQGGQGGQQQQLNGPQVYGSSSAGQAPQSTPPPPPLPLPGDQAFTDFTSGSSLFGAGGGSIWSSQPGGASVTAVAPNHMSSGGLWSGAPPPGWPGQPQQSLYEQQQQQQQLSFAYQDPQQRQPAYQPPLQFAPQHHLQPALHTALPSQQGLPPAQQQQLQAPPHQPQQLHQHPPYLQQQLGHIQQQQQLPPHLQHLAQPQLHPAPYAPLPQRQPQQQPQQQPVMPNNNPLAALLQQGSMPPPPPQLQQQQQQQLGLQQQAGTLPGMQVGPWGTGALFAGLPAMQPVQQQQQQQQWPQQQQQQQHLGGLDSRSAIPQAPQLPNSQEAPRPEPGLTLDSLLRAYTIKPPSVQSSGSLSPPPLPSHSQQQPAEASHHHQRQQQQQQQQQGLGDNGLPEQPAPGLIRKVTIHRMVKPGSVAKPGSGRENRWVDVMDRSHDGRQPKANMEELDAALRQMADSLMPTPEERGAQLEAFERIKSLLQARYPGAGVHLFGSVANGLSVRHNNDIDVCLELEGVEDQAGKAEVAVVVGKLMEDAGMADVLPLPKARVPVVKFVVPRIGTKVDVTVNNVLACINTKLVADYCAIDCRLASLVALVKHWAKQRAVNDPYRGTLSSYCYVLMCIHLLQTRPTPVLPKLQQLPPTFLRVVGQWTCQFCDNVEPLRGFGSANRESLAQLMWAFFEYWAWRHNYSHDVVSVRLGACLHKDDKDWNRRIGNERHLVCIEDPFELSHDLGRTVDRQTRAVLHKEFTRAATLLRDADDPLDQLFAAYRVGQRG